MPVRNASSYLYEAINSVQNQTFSDFELVVIDDGSTDATRDLVQEMSRSDPRIRLLSNPGQGISAALNAGIENSQADIIARMDGDDICEPERLVRQIYELNADRDLAGIGSQITKIDSKGLPFGVGRYPLAPADCRAFAAIGSPFCHPAMMLRRRAMKRAGLYRSAFDGAEDIDLWLRMLRWEKMANIPDRLLRYRVHATNSSSEWKEKPIKALLLSRLGAEEDDKHISDDADLEQFVFENKDNKNLLRHLFIYMALNGVTRNEYDELLNGFLYRYCTEESPSVLSYWMLRLLKAYLTDRNFTNALRIIIFIMLKFPGAAANEFFRTLISGSTRPWHKYLEDRSGALGS